MIPEISLDTHWRYQDFDYPPDQRIDGISLPLLANFQPRQIERKFAWVERAFNLPLQDVCINYHLSIETVPRGTQLSLNGHDLGEITVPFTTDVTALVALEDNLLVFRVFRGAAGVFGTVRLTATPCD